MAMKCLETLVDSKPECPKLNIVMEGWKKGEEFRHLDIADIHLGSLRNDMGEHMSLERAEQAFDEFLQEVDRYKPHLVIIAGDTYMHKTVTEAEERCWADFISTLLHRVKVLLQPGNHDFLERQLTTLDSLQKLCDKKLVKNLIMTSYDSQLVTFCAEDDHDHKFTILNCPCMTPLAVNEVMQANVVIYHGNVRGAIMDNGYVIPEGEDHRMTLPFKMADLFILGDIHKRQWVAPNAYYTGSMYQTKFSEDPDKGYVRGVFRINDEGQFDWFSEHVTLETPYRLHTVMVESNEDWPEDWSKFEQYYVRVIKNVNVTERPTLPYFVIKEIFSGSLKSDTYNSEVNVDIQNGQHGLQSLDFLDNQFEGANDFITHMAETSDLEITDEVRSLALVELEDVRDTIGR